MSTWLLVVIVAVVYLACGVGYARAHAERIDDIALDDIGEFGWSLVFAVTWPAWLLRDFVFGGMEKRKAQIADLRAQADSYDRTAKAVSDASERAILTSARDQLLRQAETINKKARG